nr:efflux RND transporter permease subunit [Methylocystis bryophila]
MFRPVATWLLMAVFLIAGCAAYSFLPLSALPNVDYPTIQVQAFLPGASPEMMTSTVTTPLERQLGQMPGLIQMASTSSAGASVITLQFGLNLSLDVAEQEVQAAINAASNLLPPDLPSPPTYAKINPADAPIMTLAITSSTLALTEVEEIAETRLAQKISQLPGVGLVSVNGGNRRAVRIRFDPRSLAAHRLGIDDLRAIIGNANVNAPKGSFDGPAQASTINANDQITNLEDYKGLIIAYRAGRPVRLTDVATVEFGPENTKLAAWANRTRAIILDIRRQPGANVVEVTESVKALLPGLESTLPAAIDIAILSDRTTTIRASIANVQFELALAVILVVLIIYLFLRNLSATIIAGMSVPLSIVGTFAAMPLLGFGLDNLSLMALTISTGFVVDDAIVMTENIIRHRENGSSPLQAALKGSQEIGFTIITLTISLIAALIPLLFMADVVGRLFHEFAITLAAALVISAIVSLTLVPMLCARSRWRRAGAAFSRLDQLGDGLFDKMKVSYRKALQFTLRRQPHTLTVAVITLAVTVALYVVIPKGFFPVQDTGMIQAITEAPQSVSLEAMARLQTELADRILSDPAVESLSSFIGVDGINATRNSGRFLINLRSWSERRLSAADVVRRLQRDTADVAGVRLSMQPVQDMTIDAGVSRAQYSFILQSADPGELNGWTARLMQELERAPELSNVASDLQQAGLAVDLIIDRTAASRFGIAPATVDNMLYDAFGQRIVSTIYTQSNQYRVILEVDPNLQSALESLSTLYLPSSVSTSNGQVPLSEIVHVVQRHGPLSIMHLGQFPATTIFFDVAPGASLASAVRAIERAEKEIGLPVSFTTSFQGAVAAFRASASKELLLIAAAIVTMYIVLGVLYESFIHPITILSTLPSAGLGALLTLLALGKGLDIIGFIGIILLIGIVKKNAIMIVDFALNAQRSGGLPAQEAVFQACLLRLRPILMTTLAAIFGALPMMLGTGVGSELRQPLGAAIVGGLILSQAMTLFTTPVIYLYFDRLGARLAGWKAASALAAGESEE